MSTTKANQTPPSPYEVQFKDLTQYLAFESLLGVYEHMHHSELLDLKYHNFKTAMLAILGLSHESSCSIAQITAIAHQAMEWEWTLSTLHRTFDQEEE